MALSTPPRFVLGPSTLVRDIVLHVPGAAQTMQRYRIDYCCDGHETLEKVCRDTRLAIAEVIAAIEDERKRGGESDAGLLSIPLAQLVEHIVSEHHVRARAHAALVASLILAARGAARDESPALAPFTTAAERHFATLLAHLAAEESVLFPHAIDLERAGAAGEPAPAALFSSVRHVIVDLERDHHREEATASELRRLAADLRVTTEAAPAIRELRSALEAHETDLQRHMHLEGNVLFPRVVRLETKLSATARRR